MNSSKVTGNFDYKGIHTKQVENIKLYFEQFLIQENFQTIIEIGTHKGGLTAILSDIGIENNLEYQIMTMDIVDDVYDSVKDASNVTFLQMGALSEIIKYCYYLAIPNYGKTLVLCDGGDKIEEFKAYSKIIKYGDFIMVHDYVEDKIKFDEEFKDKIWNWHQVEYKDLHFAITENELKAYEKINFDNSVWGCFYKEKIDG